MEKMYETLVFNNFDTLIKNVLAYIATIYALAGIAAVGVVIASKYSYLLGIIIGVVTFLFLFSVAIHAYFKGLKAIKQIPSFLGKVVAGILLSFAILLCIIVFFGLYFAQGIGWLRDFQ